MRAAPLENNRKLSSEGTNIANLVDVHDGGTQGEPMLLDKNVICSEPNEIHVDAASLNPEESLEGESDIDDVPDVIAERSAVVARKPRKLSHIDLVAVFQSLRYKSLSLFGPMACCFLIA